MFFVNLGPCGQRFKGANMAVQNRLHSDTCAIVLQGDFATIQMAGGHVAVVDKGDVERLESASWHLHCGYARGFVNGKKVYMHRHILGLDKSEVCDHINGNRLDNRRENLRRVDKQRNARNRVINDGYNGVRKLKCGRQDRVTVLQVFLLGAS